MDKPCHHSKQVEIVDSVGVTRRTLRMKSLARSYVWWPSLDKEIKEVVKQCEACQSLRNKPARIDPPHPWIILRSHGRVHADFCEFAGKQYLLMLDSFSKWPEVLELGTHATTA